MLKVASRLQYYCQIMFKVHIIYPVVSRARPSTSKGITDLSLQLASSSLDITSPSKKQSYRLRGNYYLLVIVSFVNGINQTNHFTN